MRWPNLGFIDVAINKLAAQSCKVCSGWMAGQVQGAMIQI